MTKLQDQHMHRYAGLTLNRFDGVSFYAIEYGALRSVYADQACNYSYREFWF